MNVVCLRPYPGVKHRGQGSGAQPAAARGLHQMSIVSPWLRLGGGCSVTRVGRISATSHHTASGVLAMASRSGYAPGVSRRATPRACQVSAVATTSVLLSRLNSRSDVLGTS